MRTLNTLDGYQELGSQRTLKHDYLEGEITRHAVITGIPKVNELQERSFRSVAFGKKTRHL